MVTKIKQAKTKRSCRLLALALALALVVAACGGGDASSEELQKVTVRMDWTSGGYHAPFPLAEEKGFYAECGLTVETLEGEGSTSTSQVIAVNNDTFGWVQAGSAMTLTSQGADVVLIAPVLQKSTTFIASPVAANILEPSDLVGKRFGLDPGGSDATMVPLFLSKTNVSEDDVDIINIGSVTALQLMLEDKIDAATFESIFQIPILEAEGIDYNGMFFADFGLNIMAYTIITNASTIEDDPEMVQCFVDGSIQGWDYAVENPEEAIEALNNRFPASPDTALAQLTLSFPLLHTATTEGKPIGCADPNDIVAAEAIFADAGIIENPTGDASTYYNDAFVKC